MTAQEAQEFVSEGRPKKLPDQKRRKYLWALILALAFLFALGMFFYYRQSIKTEMLLAEGDLRVERAELAYLLNLKTGLTSNQTNDIEVFLSEGSINQILSGATSVPITITRTPETILVVHSFSANFKDGFPLITIAASVSRPSEHVGADIEATACLEPVISSDNQSLALRLNVLDVTPSVQIGLFKWKVRALMKDMLQLRLSQYTDSLPKTAIPLATDFKLDIPGASQSLHMQTIPANNSFLSGNLSIPAIQLSEPLSIRSIVFLKEGLLVGLVNGPAITTAISTAAGEMPSNLASVKGEINRVNGQIENVRKEIDPLLSPIRVSGTSIQVHVAVQLLQKIISSINQLPLPQRTVTYANTGGQGQLVDNNAGPLGCGYFLELNGWTNLSAAAALANVSAAWNADGSIKISPTAQLSGSASVHWQVKHVRILNNCIGGGFGGVVGGSISPNTGVTLDVAVHMTSTTDQWLTYNIDINGPSQTQATISVHAGQLGDIGIPVPFSIPTGTIMSGVAPNMFSKIGRVEIGNPPLFARDYEMLLKPTNGNSAANGFTARGAVNVKWH